MTGVENFRVKVSADGGSSRLIVTLTVIRTCPDSQLIREKKIAIVGDSLQSEKVVCWTVFENQAASNWQLAISRKPQKPLTTKDTKEHRGRAELHAN